MSDVKPAYQGELMLAGWTDSHTTGAKVTFWLPDQESLEAFRHLTVRKGRTAGQRFMAVLIQIGDDEQPIEPGSDTKPARRNNALALSAVQVCKDSTFHDFIAEAVGFLPADVAGREAIAADYLRDYCHIESRAELDASPTASQLFARLMGEYRDWRRATGAGS